MAYSGDTSSAPMIASSVTSQNSAIFRRSSALNTLLPVRHTMTFG
jgi:hypothetical protein